MAQPVPPAPAAPSADEQFVVSGELKKRKDKLGRHMVNHYVLHEKIGRGQHGTVYRAADEYRDDRLVAIKIVARNNPRAEKFKALRQNRTPLPRDGTHVPLTARIGSTENKIRKEIAIMKKCKNAHIVRLLEVIDDKTNRKIYMGPCFLPSLFWLRNSCNIVMEYMGGGEVKWRDNKENPILTVDQTRRIIRDVVLGIEYRMHLTYSL
jgi:SNF1-activating kinase 1